MGIGTSMIRKLTTHARLALVGTVLITVTISGCSAPPNPQTSGSNHPSIAPTASASPTPVLPTITPVDPNVLFTITATATSPAGAVADLTQIVYKPTTNAASVAQLDAECGSWQDYFTPSVQYLASTVTAVDRSPAGKSWSSSVAVVSMNGFPVFTGDFGSFQSPCASVFINIGTANGVTPVDAGSPDANRGWAMNYYGFGIATEDPGAESAGPNDTVISNCAISLSDFAVNNSSIASGWATAPQQYPDLGCSFGSPF
jgi:hypothetical protein